MNCPPLILTYSWSCTLFCFQKMAISSQSKNLYQRHRYSDIFLFILSDVSVENLLVTSGYWMWIIIYNMTGFLFWFEIIWFTVKVLGQLWHLGLKSQGRSEFGPSWAGNPYVAPSALIGKVSSIPLQFSTWPPESLVQSDGDQTILIFILYHPSFPFQFQVPLLLQYTGNTVELFFPFCKSPVVAAGVEGIIESANGSCSMRSLSYNCIELEIITIYISHHFSSTFYTFEITSLEQADI